MHPKSRMFATVLVQMLLGLGLSTAAWAGGPQARWGFDQGDAQRAVDDSGQDRHAKIHGASRERLGDGFALRLDGKDDHVEFSEGPGLGLTGPVSIAAWIKPTAKAQGLSPLLGQDMHSYLLAWYATDHCYWYIGAGANKIGARLKLHQWNHVVATFDGQRMALWVNGRLAAGRKSEHEGYAQRDRFTMGTKGSGDGPRFQGLLDDVRVYDRALTGVEVIAQIRAEGSRHGLAIRKRETAAFESGTDFFTSHPNPIDVEERGDVILMANRQVGLSLRRHDSGFELLRLFGIAAKQDFLVRETGIGQRDLFEISMSLDPKHIGRDDRLKEIGSLLGIVHEMAGDAFAIGAQSAESTSWRREQQDDQCTLHLEWKGISVAENKHAMDAFVTITLRTDDPMVYWRIRVDNGSTRYGIERVRFPILAFAPIGDAKDNMFLMPRGRGVLVENPFDARTGFGANYASRGAFYSHDFNMQFQALYNRRQGHGIYLGTRDPTPHLTSYQIINTPAEITWRLAHFPPNIRFSQESYVQPYDCVTGPFAGDWFDACQIYRAWAIQQSWCRKGPLASRSEAPRWFKEAPLIFYTTMTDSAEGTHSIHENLQIAADHFHEWLRWSGMKLPLNFYSWHEYDPSLTVSNMPFHNRRMQNHPGRWTQMPSTYEPSGNYPEIPAMRGFADTCRKLRAAGGMVCPYVALEIFDQGPTNDAPHARAADRHITRDLFGAKRLWGSLRFWQPCSWTGWWQQRLADTTKLMLQREHIGGFYLDVMQGSALPCYWTPHGHAAGGGSSSTVGMHRLTSAIYDAVKAQDSEAITTGENMSENMIDVTDGALQVTLWADTKVPVFAAVYQDYITRYGLELSNGFGTRDAFYIECTSLFVEGSQVGRLRLRPRDRTLSFDNPDDQEMIAFLGRIVGYYRQEMTRNFLAYGQLMRPVEFTAPSPMPMLDYTGSLVKTKTQFPALTSGVFRSPAGELGIFVANASYDEHTFHVDFDPARHGMSKGVVVQVDAYRPDGTSQNVHSEATGIIPLRASLPGHGITMFRVRAIH